jgi:hypothetical protein
MLKYEEADEPLLRRLGGALVFQWGALPEEVRKLLLEQAVFMFDRHQTVQLKQQLEAFIQKHQSKNA